MENVGRYCFLRYGTESAAPSTEHNYVRVFACDSHPNRCRLFKIVGLNPNREGHVRYRLVNEKDESEVTLVELDDVVVVSRYVLTSRPSWHQRNAGHQFGSVILLWMTDEQRDKRRVKDGDTLWSGEEAERIWNTIEPILNKL